MSWIASFASLYLKYPCVSRAQQCEIALGSMSTILRVPNAAGSAYTEPCARDQPSYMVAGSDAARRMRPTPKSQLGEGGPEMRAVCAPLWRILETCDDPTMTRRARRKLVGVRRGPREPRAHGLVLDMMKWADSAALSGTVRLIYI